jgi:hypothetical protein
MNVARTTYRAVLVAAALSTVAVALPASADDRGGWREDWHGDRDGDRWRDERRYGDRDGDRGAYRWRDDRRDGRYRDRYDDRPRHWVPPGHRYGWQPAPRWAPPRSPLYYSPYPPRGYYAPRYAYPPGYYWRGSHAPRHYWRDDGDVQLTIRIPF